MDTSPNKGKILLTISGSIAAYKAADLTSLLTQKGYEVQCLLTENAKQFVTPTVLETLSHFPVQSDLFGPGISGTEHIRLARWADLIVFAPATANLLTKLALGFADDLVTTIALATKAPWLVVPAMNTVMWEKEIIQEHIKTLLGRGACFLNPEEGTLACGEAGVGKLATPEKIFEKIEGILNLKEPPSKPLLGLKLLITAGSTISRIDSVRYITNPSTGKMGAAMAEEALARGAEVYYVLGLDKGVVRPNIPQSAVNQFHLFTVETAEEMLDIAFGCLKKVHGVIATAAVSDYRVKNSVTHKLKRSSKSMSLELLPSVDVLSSLRSKASSGQWFFGFAAESENLLENAEIKFKKKNLDFLFANPIRTPQTGFGASTNSGFLFQRKKEAIEFALTSKKELASKIWDLLEKEVKKTPSHTLLKTRGKNEDLAYL